MPASSCTDAIPLNAFKRGSDQSSHQASLSPSDVRGVAVIASAAIRLVESSAHVGDLRRGGHASVRRETHHVVVSQPYMEQVNGIGNALIRYQRRNRFSNRALAFDLLGGRDVHELTPDPDPPAPVPPERAVVGVIGLGL